MTYRRVARAVETNTLTCRMEDALKLRQLEAGSAVAERLMSSNCGRNGWSLAVEGVKHQASREAGSSPAVFAAHRIHALRL